MSQKCLYCIRVCVYVCIYVYVYMADANKLCIYFGSLISELHCIYSILLTTIFGTLITGCLIRDGGLVEVWCSYRNQTTDKSLAIWLGPNFGFFFLTFQANNIVHYKVDCEPSSVKKSAELGDEREVKLKGISGSDSVFYNTVSG